VVKNINSDPSRSSRVAFKVMHNSHSHHSPETINITSQLNTLE
jgi:hypothetical protein